MRPLLAFIFVLPAAVLADITATRDSADFTGSIDQIEGDTDPVTLASFGAHPTYGAPTTTLNGDGTVTITTPGDSYPVWDLAVANNHLDSATGWTWETRFRIDSANVPNRGVWEIFLRDNDSGLAATRIHFLEGGLDRDTAGFGVDAEIAADLTDDFHVVRAAVEGGTNATTV
jgi:hypothetical protein